MKKQELYDAVKSDLAPGEQSTYLQQRKDDLVRALERGKNDNVSILCEMSRVMIAMELTTDKTNMLDALEFIMESQLQSMTKMQELKSIM